MSNENEEFIIFDEGQDGETEVEGSAEGDSKPTLLELLGTDEPDVEQDVEPDDDTEDREVYGKKVKKRIDKALNRQKAAEQKVEELEAQLQEAQMPGFIEEIYGTGPEVEGDIRSDRKVVDAFIKLKDMNDPTVNHVLNLLNEEINKDSGVTPTRTTKTETNTTPKKEGLVERLAQKTLATTVKDVLTSLDIDPEYHTLFSKHVSQNIDLEDADDSDTVQKLILEYIPDMGINPQKLLVTGSGGRRNLPASGGQAVISRKAPTKKKSREEEPPRSYSESVKRRGQETSRLFKEGGYGDKLDF